MNARKIADAIGDRNIGHVLIHYAHDVHPYIEFHPDGSLNTRGNATRTFARILEALGRDKEMRELMLQAVRDEQRLAREEVDEFLRDYGRLMEGEE